ncbi:MAG: AAA family ATPase [Caldisericia bacterium]|jgi:ATP/maltotriose-dependent transcriptional regulator MalT/DNA-binding SARP family transcriptional activator|nr:AAA family ATPase [Caldisericia bacterium]
MKTIRSSFNFKVFKTKRILDKLNLLLDKKLIFIEGRAGSGKTTLIKLLFESKDNFIYFSFNEEQKDFRFFLNSLLGKLTKDNFSIPEKDKLNFILNLLEDYEEEFIIILDDVHFIYENKESIELIKKLIENTNQNIKFILASRYKLKEKFYDLILKFEVGIIDDKDLMLNEKEIKEFFEFYNIKIDKRKLDEIYKKSSGWILYLNLISKYYKGDLKLYDLNLIEKFFDEQILSKLSDKESDALKIFTLNETLNKYIIQNYNSNIYEIIKEIVSKNLFIEEVDDSFKIHPVLKEILIKKFGLLEKNFAFKIGELYENNNLFIDSLNIYFKYNEFYKAKEVIKRWGRQLFVKDEVNLIENYLNKLPTNIFDDDLFLIKVEIEKNRGNLKEAENLIKKINTKNLNLDFKKFYFITKGELLYKLGNYKQSLKLLKRFKFENNLEIKRMHLLAVVNFFLEKIQDFEKYINKAIKLAKETKEVYREIKLLNDMAVGLYEPRGMIHEFDLTFKKIEYLMNKNNIPGDPIIFGNIGYINLILGNLNLAEKYATHGLKFARKEDNKLKIIFNLRVLGTIYIRKKEFNKAKNCLEEALLLSEQSPDPSRKIGVLYILSMLYEKLGDFDKSIYYAMEDYKIVNKLSNSLFIAQSNLNLGRIYFSFKKFEESKKHLKEAAKIFEKLNANLYLFETYLYLFLNPLNFPAEKEIYKEKIIEMIKTYGYGFFIKSNFDKDLSNLILKEIESDLKKCYVVQTFGTFKLIVDGIEIKDKEWKRERVKNLFKYLLIKGGKALKDEIYEELFLDLPSKTREINLRVSLSILRKILDKESKKPYILFQKRDLIYLNLDEFYIDFYIFEKLGNEGLEENNKQKILEALDIYKGKFLYEDRYKDFVIYKTNKLEDLYVKLLNRLAFILENENKIEESINLLKKSLEIDPFQDDILKRFFDLLKLKKKKFEYLKIYKEFYEKYKTNWDIDIDEIIKNSKIL